MPVVTGTSTGAPTVNGTPPPPPVDPGNPLGAPPPPPPPPKRRGRPPGSKNTKKASDKISDTQLRDALIEVFGAPGVAFSMTGQEWPAAHVMTTAPDFAQQIVTVSNTNEAMRSWLERQIASGAPLGLFIAVYGLTMAGATYLLPLLAYFGAIPRTIGEKFVEGRIPTPVPPTMGPEYAGTAPASPAENGAAPAATSYPVDG